MLLLVAVWGARLFAHSMRTNSRVETQPYAAWRKRYGERWWWWSYFQVYLLQGVLLLVWVLPVAFVMARTDTDFGAREVIAIIVWLAGFGFQAGADWQLKQFKAQPDSRGKVLRSGLWALSRHPNYFGEAVMWFSFFIMATGHPWGWLTIVGPLYTAWFMSVGSAAAGNDRHQLRTKPEYAEYVRDVPMFFPRLWPKRRPGDQ